MLRVPKTDISRVRATEAYKWAIEAASDKSRQCSYVRLAADRFLNDLKRDDIYFDDNEYARVLRFYRIFRHTKGLLRGQRFDLRDDQKFFIGQIMAWKRRDNGGQRITETYKEVARKNGKSWEAGGLAGYHLTSAGENEAEVYSLATSEKQARESWNAFKSMSRTVPNFSKTLEYRVDEIRHPKTSSIFQPLPSVGENLDGKNPSFILTDEYHLFKKIDDESRQSLLGGAVARERRLEFKITTGGSNIFGSCYDERKRAIDVLRGTIELDFYLPMIFTLDDGDDWQDEQNWYKANPALGISKSLEAMRQQFQMAQHSPRLINVFKNKQLDLWTNELKAWLDVGAWQRLAKDISDEELRGKRCIIGMDLAQTNDLVAFAFLFPTQSGLDKFHLKTMFFCPQIGALRREADKVPYMTWANQGYIHFSGLKRVEMAEIADKVLGFIKSKGYNIDFVAYDAWKANVMIEAFKNAGIRTEAIKQYFKFLSPACRRLEELIDEGQITHDGNVCMNWNIGNVIVDMDSNGNIRPNKQKSTEKIDGVAALIDALAGIDINKDGMPAVIDTCPISII